VPNEKKLNRLLLELAYRPRAALAQLPTPIHELKNFGKQLDGQELWIKRDDLTGLEGGGNKTRKLEFLVGDAIASGADMLVTAGAIQSNHTRQTAAAAAKCNLKCALLHFGWAKDAGPVYRQVGNVLISSMMGPDMFLDETERPIEDQSPLVDFFEYQKSLGHTPYLIPAGASEHRLGSLGYMACAAEIVKQSEALDVLAAMGENMRVIGVADDDETDIKKGRVLQLANDALAEIGMSERVAPSAVEIIAADKSPYGKADSETIDAINLLARTEGLIADPVYEHAYASQFDSPKLKKFPK